MAESMMPDEPSRPDQPFEGPAVRREAQPAPRRRPYLFCLACLCYGLGGIGLWLGEAWGPGMYAGHLHGWIDLSPAPGAPEFSSGWLHFTGETPRRFCYRQYYPVRYERLQLTGEGGELELLLPGMTYRWGTRSGTCTPAVLREFVAARQDPNLIPADQLEKLYGFLAAAGGGDFPRPRHHPYYLGDLEGKDNWPRGISIRFTHFAIGGNWGGFSAIVILGIAVGLHLAARRGCGRKLGGRP